MKAEIDQSGKIEQLDTDTIVAYANGKSGAVWLPAGMKRKIVVQIRKSLIPEPDLKALWFAVVVFLLIKDLPNGITFVIDEEYTGKEIVIERVLAKLLNRKFKDKWIGNIRFRRIGKRSPAHGLALKWHRTKIKTDLRRIRENEVLNLLK